MKSGLCNLCPYHKSWRLPSCRKKRFRTAIAIPAHPIPLLVRHCHRHHPPRFLPSFSPRYALQLSAFQQKNLLSVVTRGYVIIVTRSGFSTTVAVLASTYLLQTMMMMTAQIHPQLSRTRKSMTMTILCPHFRALR